MKLRARSGDFLRNCNKKGETIATTACALSGNVSGNDCCLNCHCGCAACLHYRNVSHCHIQPPFPPRACGCPPRTCGVTQQLHNRRACAVRTAQCHFVLLLLFAQVNGNDFPSQSPSFSLDYCLYCICFSYAGLHQLPQMPFECGGKKKNVLMKWSKAN